MLCFFVSLFLVATAEGHERVSRLMRIRMEFHGKVGRFCLGSQIGQRPRWRYTLLCFSCLTYRLLKVAEGFELEADNSESSSS